MIKTESSSLVSVRELLSTAAAALVWVMLSCLLCIKVCSLKFLCFLWQVLKKNSGADHASLSEREGYVWTLVGFFKVNQSGNKPRKRWLSISWEMGNTAQITNQKKALLSGKDVNCLASKCSVTILWRCQVSSPSAPLSAPNQAHYSPAFIVSTVWLRQ